MLDFNKKGYIKEWVLNLNAESDKFLMVIVPLVLNVNVHLKLIEKPILNEADNTYTYQPKSFIYSSFGDDNENCHDIHLFMRFGHFDICYKKQFFVDNNVKLSCFIYSEADIDNLNSNEQGYTVIENNFKCKECHKENSKKVKFPDQIDTVCINCLSCYANDILEQRIKHFLSEQYFNKECNNLTNCRLL